MARTFAQKHGLSQDAFDEMMGLHAALEVGTAQHIANAKAAELAKLGPAGTSRFDAANTWLRAMVGEELGKEFTKFLYTSKQVETLERLMERFRTQGGGSFTHQHREAPEPEGRWSEEQYQKASPAARLDYVRRFPQPATNGAGR